MLMRLFEYANSASFTSESEIVLVTRPMIIFEGCAQLPLITGKAISPQYWLPL